MFSRRDEDGIKTGIRGVRGGVRRDGMRRERLKRDLIGSPNTTVSSIATPRHMHSFSLSVRGKTGDAPHSKTARIRCRADSRTIVADGAIADARARSALRRWWAPLLALSACLLGACSAGGSTMRDRPRPDWTPSDMPSQEGRIFLVTGGTSGIGYESARALAAAGAQVVIAARNPARGDEAIARIRHDDPDARVRFEALDLGDLASVRALAARLDESLPRLDGLINNAAIMEPPERGTSAEGLEMQFAVNYLGHFALTAELLPLLRKAEAPRVVTLSSIAARRGALHFQDLQFEQDYDPTDAYRQSKLACLMFAMELQRRSDAEGWGIRSMASHPGLSMTGLQLRPDGSETFVRRYLPFLFQSAARGAIPTLYAATAPDARRGTYYGPTGVMEVRGPLGLAAVPAAAADEQAAARLWALSEELSGTHYPARPAD